MKFGLAWLGLCTALAVHVVDEAMTDFLSVYNPMVLAIRRRLPFLPLPVFTFKRWLGGLCGLVLLVFGLSPLALAGNKVAVAMAFPYGIIMAGNAVGHLAASIYRRRFMPGVYSSPLLLAASIVLLYWAQRLAGL